MYTKIVFANYFSFTNVLNDGAGRRTARLVWSPTVNNNRSKWVAMGETPAQMHMSWWASVHKQLSWIICSNELLMLSIRSRTKPIYFYQLANSDSAYATRNRKYIYIYIYAPCSGRIYICGTWEANRLASCNASSANLFTTSQIPHYDWAKKKSAERVVFS